MLRLYLLAGIAFCSIASTSPPPAPAPAQSASQASRGELFELRTYYPEKGKLAALNSRFRDHTLKLFAKHGMRNVAYWNELPTDAAPEGRLIYVVAHADRAAQENNWKAFRADPEWQAVVAKSEADGKLVIKVDSVLMTATDYSPMLLANPKDRRAQAKH